MSAHLEALRAIGWQGQLPGQALMRVVAQHRASYELHDGDALHVAQPQARFLRPGLEPEQRPAVGDFVRVRPGNPLEIEAIEPRRSVLLRAAAGERYKRQVIATNIDAVMVLTGLDGDFNAARIERYLTLVSGSGVQPVVLLTKADKVDGVAQRVAALAARLPAATPVLAINAKNPDCLVALERWLQAGVTIALVGSSGAGKSTLSNTLLGQQRMATGAVRGRDSRGRHTTVHRALLQLPGGACLIDTPGMRELKLTGDEDLDSFDDIENLAAQCRFNDCAHAGEPGCAVRAAIDAGTLNAARVRSYDKLRNERAHQAETRAAREQRRSAASKPTGRSRSHRGHGEQ